MQHTCLVTLANSGEMKDDLGTTSKTGSTNGTDTESDRPIISMEGVTLLREGRPILADLTWEVHALERWVLLGPNGSGKTTLLRVAGAQLRPSKGTVYILGERIGASDLRQIRKRVGFMSPALGRQLRTDETILEVVLSGRYAALETWWNGYSPDDYKRASYVLDDLGISRLADRTYGVISEGERQLVLLARTLMADPELLLLDEPVASLDMGARKRFLTQLERMANDLQAPPYVLVTHRLEEIPKGTTHVGLLKEGRLLAAGLLEQTLTDELLAQCFD